METKSAKCEPQAETTECRCCSCGKPFLYVRARGRPRKVCDECKKLGITQVQHEHVCKSCGKAFKTELRASVYCSHACAKKDIGQNRKIWDSAKDRDNHHDHVRRARLKLAYVEKVKASDVFARDGYICKLCGKPAGNSSDMHMRPTIDHVIPLAVGGRHAMDNVQCAHWICNSRKSCYPESFTPGV